MSFEGSLEWIFRRCTMRYESDRIVFEVHSTDLDQTYTALCQRARCSSELSMNANVINCKDSAIQLEDCTFGVLFRTTGLVNGS